MRSHRRSVIALVSLTILLGAAVLWACGPYFPNWLLGSDALVLEAPVARFQQEVERLLPQAGTVVAVVDEEKGPFQQTAEADRADLEAALQGTSSEQRQALLDRHRALRDALLQLADGGAVSGLTVPTGLPAEFEDYLRGAVAYRQGNFDEARAAWTRLLDRPAAERRFRSTWASFMLGKAALRDDPEAAVRWFERTRELASQGFRDTLGLAASSLGWQARAEAAQARYDRALRLYAQQLRSGDPTALNSLRFTAEEVLTGDREALLRMARAADTRQILTSYVLSQSQTDDWGDPVQDSPLRAWLDAVQAAGVEDLEGADRLAWAAYAAGDFQAADRWLNAAPDSPMARWIRAKLLLREGKLAKAEALLAQVKKELPDEAPAAGGDWSYSGILPAIPTPLRVSGESGSVQLSRREYVSSLDEFLRGGYWLDAAYVAEQVLSIQELQRYVDEKWPADLAAQHDPESPWSGFNGGVSAPPEPRTAFELRHLLARRLARAGKYPEARAYFPEKLRPRLDELAKSLQTGKDWRRPRSERASALLRAGCVTRQSGLELLGTEIEPDWFFFEAQYDPEFITKARASRTGNRWLKPASDELERARLHRIEPWKRFHYRYHAADLAWEAAALLPDGSPAKARTLALGGTWLKARDPEFAERFYKALVRCCGETDLGREAEELRWFPEVEGCAAEEQ